MTTESLSKEQLAEIERRLADPRNQGGMQSACGEYECDCHRELPSVLAHIRTLEAERGETDLVPRSRYDAANSDWLEAKQRLENVQSLATAEIDQLHHQINELTGRLREVEAERDRLRLPIKAQATTETVMKQAVDDFRRRAIEAVRALFHNSKVESARWNQAINNAVGVLQSLPATNDKVDDEK